MKKKTEPESAEKFLQRAYSRVFHAVKNWEQNTEKTLSDFKKKEYDKHTSKDVELIIKKYNELLLSSNYNNEYKILFKLILDDLYTDSNDKEASLVEKEVTSKPDLFYFDCEILNCICDGLYNKENFSCKKVLEKIDDIKVSKISFQYKKLCKYIIQVKYGDFDFENYIHLFVLGMNPYNFKKLVSELSDILDKIPFPKSVKELFQIKTLQRINKEIESNNNKTKEDK
jgi:hypothetical protein